VIVSWKIRNLEKLNEFLKKLPYGGVRIALKAFTEYVIGNESHGLKHNEPYKYVSRKRAYGQTFQSDKQRKYVMARIRSGEITPGKPNRTGNTSDGWQYTMVTDWNYSVNNPEPGAYWTRGDTGQARQPALVGWRKVTKVAMDNFAGGVRAAEAAISKWIKSNG
jgi:hypothetical protein